MGHLIEGIAQSQIQRVCEGCRRYPSLQIHGVADADSGMTGGRHNWGSWWLANKRRGIERRDLASLKAVESNKSDDDCQCR